MDLPCYRFGGLVNAMNKSTISVLVVLLLTLGGFVFGYYQKGSTSTDQVASFAWNDVMPEAREMLRVYFPGSRTEAAAELQGPAKLVAEDDITGDGIPEALIDLNQGGGSSVVLVQMINGKPMVAPVYRTDGNPGLIVGSMYSTNDVENIMKMLPEQNAIYLAIRNKNGCEVYAYRWNNERQAFVENPNLAAEIHQNYCR